ncbi:YdjC-like protein [Cohaesibacter sp. ES.047]|uniref:ChbG/HpnK family deacetylase n=1 Tax=Cohaesibacter sp. ES.047 TaxID=1798205 RepID=UPI000BB78F62|nr:ChbG/HpnK family deacetylase [Cohaesibacter sp. ES.047]SNY92094.1 YdjC-like protein [Cohaesibacter sp. ES.047]
MLCALDFALSEGVDEAIMDLAGRQVIGAIACLSVSDIWPQEAHRLQSRDQKGPPKIPVGLTLTLTKSFPPLSSGFFPDNRQYAGRLPDRPDLARAARSLNLRTNVIEAEIRSQIRRFLAHWGSPPAFVHLEPPILLFEVAVRAVTAALSQFKLLKCPILVAELPRPRGLVERAERRWLWRSAEHARQPWQRRMLLELKDPARVPQKNSWRIDTRVWTGIRPAVDSPRDQARLERFDQDPSARVSQYQLFCD